jgi:hypothetical protein
VLRNGPAAGHCRGLAEFVYLIARRSPFNVVWRRCSATLLGFYPDCPSQRSSNQRVFSTSVATLPRAVEPRASRDVFSVRHRCRGPVLVLAGMGRFVLSSGFWDLAPPASRFRALVRPRLGLGTKGRFDPRTVLPWASPLSGFAPSNPGSPLPGPIRSWALSSRRSAVLRNARHAFTTSRHRFRRALRRRPSVS